MRVLAGLIAVLILLAGCAPRGAFSTVAPGGEVLPIFVATPRASEPPGGPLDLGADRGPLQLLRVDVSIPPAHEPGNIEWARGIPDPERHFGVAGQLTYPDIASLKREVATQLDAPREVMVFVHGYNNTLAEATYRLAQLAADYDVPGPKVLFSFASAGDPRGYIYDRDSVAVARDHLANLLVELSDGPIERITLVGHSMGGFLAMEALRTLELSGRMPPRIAVVLFSPDIDIDVFRSQVEGLGRPPNPFVLFVAPSDRILRISARLTGRTERVGNISTADELPPGVTVIDIGQLADGSSFNHQVFATSPAAIAVLSGITRQARLTGVGPDDPEFWRGVDGEGLVPL